MRRFLITGYKGFIGQNLTSQLLAINGFEGIDFPYDLCQGVPKIDADTIIHLAAFTNVRDSLIHPFTTFRNNFLSTLNILEAARQSKVTKLIFTSSAGADNPTSPYTFSKLACEALCHSYSNYFNVVILRLSNIYGPFSQTKTSVIPIFIKQLITKEPLKIFGKGDQVRDFVYVQDVIDKLLDPDVKSGYVSTGIYTPILDIANLLNNISHKLTGHKSEIHYLEPNPNEVTLVSTPSSLSNPTPLEEGLLSTFKWFLNNA